MSGFESWVVVGDVRSWGEIERRDRDPRVRNVQTIERRRGAGQ